MAAMDWSAQAGSAPRSYDEFLVPAMFTPFAEVLIERMGVEPGARVLDVACGTGAVSRVAARMSGPNGTVSAVDLGEPTLEIARSRPREDGAAAIEYRQADAAALPFEDDTFDFVVCQQGLQFFPDQPAALAEMRRVMRSGARLGIATWKDIARSPFGALADALARHLGTDAGAMMRSPFALGSRADLARMISAAGLREVSVEDVTIECTWATHRDFALRAVAAGPIAPILAAADEDTRGALSEEVAERLAPHATADGRLRMSMTSNMALATA